METDDLLKAVFAFVGGGIVNTSVLGYLFFRLTSVDRQMAKMEVHLGYIRKEVAYTNGRVELEDTK